MELHFAEAEPLKWKDREVRYHFSVKVILLLSGSSDSIMKESPSYVLIMFHL